MPVIGKVMEVILYVQDMNTQVAFYRDVLVMINTCTGHEQANVSVKPMRLSAPLHSIQ